RPDSCARRSASKLLPERAPPRISSFMGALWAIVGGGGNRHNPPFDNTEPGARNDTEAQFRGGPAAVTGDRRRNRPLHQGKQTRREGATGGPIRKPEDV